MDFESLGGNGLAKTDEARGRGDRGAAEWIASRGRVRTADGRFAPRSSVAIANRFDSALTEAELQAIGDLGAEADSIDLFDEEVGIAAWKRWTEQADQRASRERQSTLGVCRGAMPPTKASYLAHRMESLWREVQLERVNHGFRLDEPADLTFDDEGIDHFRDRLKQRLASRTLNATPQWKFCLSCGSSVNGLGSSLCHRCDVAEGASHAWVARERGVSASTVPARGDRNSQPGELGDPIDAFAEIEFGPDFDTEELPCIQPSPRQSTSAEKVKSPAWKRLFWLYVMLMICAGVASTVYGLDGTQASDREAVHEAE